MRSISSRAMVPMRFSIAPFGADDDALLPLPLHVDGGVRCGSELPASLPAIHHHGHRVRHLLRALRRSIFSRISSAARKRSG